MTVKFDALRPWKAGNLCVKIWLFEHLTIVGGEKNAIFLVY